MIDPDDEYDDQLEEDEEYPLWDDTYSCGCCMCCGCMCGWDDDYDDDEYPEEDYDE